MSLCYIIYKLYIDFAFAMVGEQSVPVDSIHTYGKFSREKIFQFQSMQKIWYLIKHVQISVSLHLKGLGLPTFSCPAGQFSRPFPLRRTVNTNTFFENVDLYLSQHHVTRWHVNGAFSFQCEDLIWNAYLMLSCEKGDFFIFILSVHQIHFSPKLSYVTQKSKTA